MNSYSMKKQLNYKKEGFKSKNKQNKYKSNKKQNNKNQKIIIININIYGRKEKNSCGKKNGKNYSKKKYKTNKSS